MALPLNKIFVAIILLFITELASGNDLDISFRTVSASNSLSQSSVLSMIQDSKGFLWFGTKDGLNRFDGYEFVSYKYDPKNTNSISNNEVSCLEIEGDRYLWIGTRSGGINRMELSTGKITRFTNLTYDDLIRDIYCDPNGNIWAGTTEGLFLFKPPVDTHEKGEFINVSNHAVFRRKTNVPFIPIRKNIPIVSILLLGEGKLLTGAEEGLFEYDINQNSFQSISDITLTKSVFTSLLQDSKGRIWTSSYDGVFRLDPVQGHTDYRIFEYSTSKPDVSFRLPVDWVEDMVEDQSGNIWLATRGAGLIRMVDDRVANVFNNTSTLPNRISDKLLNSLFIDRTGVLWIGTESHEALYVDLFAKQFRSILPDSWDNKGLSDNLVTAITGNKELLYVGTSAKGIDVFKFEQETVNKLYSIPRIYIGQGQWKSEISDLLCDSDGVLWIGSATNSLVCYSKSEGFKSYDVNGFIFSLMDDHRGNVWFGTWGQGLGYINKKTFRIEQYNEVSEQTMGLSSDKILKVYLDSKGLLWAGTKGGGVNVAPFDDVIHRRGAFTIFRHQPGSINSLSYNDVFDIFEDSQGTIWLGTASGLNRIIVPDGMVRNEAIQSGKITFEVINEKQGLPGDMVYSIKEDTKGNLWLGTNKGLSRYSIKDKNLINYGINDGLASGKFNQNSAWNDSNGRLFFGGVNGITYFDPDSIASNPFEARINISGFRLHNRSVLPGEKVNGRIILINDIAYTDQLDLAFNDNEISFAFSALHFSSPDKVRYSYRLLGFNDNWQEVSSLSRRATYTNLRFGEYVFQVKATNNDGVLSDTVRQLKIIIHPPFYLTVWAYLIYLLVFLFLLIIFRRYSLIAVTRKNQFVIESIEHKKETEIAEAKMRFFTNVSHEIRTPLTLIYAPLQQLLEKEGPETDTGKVLSMILRNVKRLLNQVNQLLELRKMEKDRYQMIYSNFSLKDLFEETLPDFAAIIHQKSIVVNLESSGDVVVNADRRLLGTVVYNLLSNAIKYSPENGQLHIKIEEREEVAGNSAVFKLSDEGPGIPEHALQKVFNRFYQLKKTEQGHLGGSGIGLSIVKEFVEQHAGSVKVYNNESKGCCFEVVLPVKKAVIGETQAELTNNKWTAEQLDVVHSTASEDPKEGDDLASKKLNLWIIEDDVELALYLKSVFGVRFDVSLFFDGSQAFEAFKDAQPDLVICDVMLPGMNGIELTTRIKANRNTSHIPIIILTAKADDDNMVGGLSAGADNYLIKPFNINVLEAQVLSLVKSRNAFRNKFSRQMVLAPTEEVLTTSDEKFLARLKEITERRMVDPTFDVANLIDDMHMSHSIILKRVKDLTGMSLVEFIRTMRIQKAAQIFRQDKLSVSEVSFMVGFSDPKYFSKCFAKEIGEKPTEYIKKYHG
ncbi:hybrid sensor histidine kinase/response regulator transcription factor [Geofilum sp. OHC36d9]|uniref:hybrid sensor histidine kinase/response regulator transcription factor n=1 Tax=Geofilum sp. OHC36d9 TaxID=3458413 RepID=UPI0040334143